MLFYPCFPQNGPSLKIGFEAMMTHKYRHVSAYLDPDRFAAISGIAEQRGVKLSALIKQLVDHEIGGGRVSQEALIDNQIKILIGVDGLLKYHTNKDVFAIVKKTRLEKLGSPPDEA